MITNQLTNTTYYTDVYHAADQSSIPGRGERIFPLTSVSRPALGPTQPPVQRVPGILSPGVKSGRA
jgi:hypothetical protein